MPFPLIKYRYTCHNTAADEQQCSPQSKVACIAGRGRLRKLRRYSAGLGDFLSAVFVTVILITAAAVPILDIALGVLGRRLGGDMLEVGVVLRVKLAVGFAADFANRFFGAGCLAAGMIGDHLATVIANVVFVCIFVVRNDLLAIIADMVIVRVLMVGDDLFANIADMVLSASSCRHAYPHSLHTPFDHS